MTKVKDDVWLLLDSRGPGGIESHVRALAQALSIHKGLQVKVMLMEDYGPHPVFDKTPFSRNTSPPQPFSIGRAGGIRGLLTKLRRSPPGLVHTHGYRAGIVGRVFCRALGIPVVSTFHAGDPGQGRVRAYTWLDEATACLAPAIAVSAPIATRLKGAARLGNSVSTIGCFIDTPAAPPEPAADIQGGGPLRFAFVGRLSHEKGPDRLPMLAQAVPEVEWHVFGDGPERPIVQAMASATLHGMVRDMQPYWRGIDLLVMPSRNEGLPMAALEAMAHGVPVAAFNVGDLNQVIAHGWTGFLATPDSCPELVRRLVHAAAIGRPGLAAMGDMARQKVLASHGVDAVLPRILDVYARALRQRMVRLQDQVTPAEEHILAEAVREVTPNGGQTGAA